MFFTHEGSAIPPNEDMDIDNCQLLGRAKGRNAAEAKVNLLNDNPWIEECGFNINETFYEEIIPH